MAEIASVRIRISDLALEWLESVADLLCEIEDTAVPDTVAAKARQVREVMLADAAEPR